MFSVSDRTFRAKAPVTMPRARKVGLVTCELDDETLVYDLERDRAHCLNQTAALVWQRCDGKVTVAEAASLLQKQLGAPVDVDVVWLALKQLQRFHLIDASAPAAVSPPSLSRRKLLLKYAPAALALPLIMSITAPTPAAGASCAGLGQACGSGHPSCCGTLRCFGTCRHDD